MVNAMETEKKTLTMKVNNLAQQVYCAVSVDGDLRVGSLDQQKEAIHAMRLAHASLGILGNTSWLINEHDFHWTELHPNFLHELAESDECIGVHDHLDTHHLENASCERIMEFFSSSRRRLEDFYRSTSKEVSIVLHRNGGAQQGREIYRALDRMPYTIVSDVWPGMRWFTRMVPIEHPVQPWKALDRPEDPEAIFTDNSQVPLVAVPWRHDPDNWLDIHSKIGRFLQVPITCLPWVDRTRVQTAIENSGCQAFLVIDTHPYNLQNPKSGDVSAELVEKYYDALVWIRETYHAGFVRLDQIPQLFEMDPEIIV
jgi:hypothetical protein